MNKENCALKLVDEIILFYCIYQNASIFNTLHCIYMKHVRHAIIKFPKATEFVAPA